MTTSGYLYRIYWITYVTFFFILISPSLRRVYDSVFQELAIRWGDYCRYNTWVHSNFNNICRACKRTWCKALSRWTMTPFWLTIFGYFSVLLHLIIPVAYNTCLNSTSYFADRFCNKQCPSNPARCTGWSLVVPRAFSLINALNDPHFINCDRSFKKYVSVAFENITVDGYAAYFFPLICEVRKNGSD